MRDIAIHAVIVTYNRPLALKKTILAIQSEGILPENIMIIDNNSTQSTSLMLYDVFPGVKSFQFSENLASAGGFAKGMQYAFENGADWVWLFNDDSRPVSGTLSSVLPFLEIKSLEKKGMIKIGQPASGGQVVVLDWKGVRVPRLVPKGNELIETDLITFDGCFISRQLYEAISTCDPEYFMGTYEFDYCLRAKDAGFTIYTLPNGLIEDEKLGSERGTPPWRQYYNTRNHLWLGLKRRSFQIVKSWMIREMKYTLAILFKGDQKGLRLLFKYRATRDALLNRRGKRYHPDLKK